MGVSRGSGGTCMRCLPLCKCAPTTLSPPSCIPACPAPLRPLQSQDAARLRSFVEDHKPHVVVLGASHPEARVLEADLKSIRDYILFDNPTLAIGACCLGGGEGGSMRLGSGLSKAEVGVLFVGEQLKPIWAAGWATGSRGPSFIPARGGRRGAWKGSHAVAQPRSPALLPLLFS